MANSVGFLLLWLIYCVLVSAFFLLSLSKALTRTLINMERVEIG